MGTSKKINMKRNLVIKKIENRLIEDLSYHKICNSDIEEYKKTVIELFRFISSYIAEYNLKCYDFRRFLDDFYFDLDLKNDFEVNRYTLIIDELAVYYTSEPYFWDTPFNVFIDKINKMLLYEL